MEFNLSNWVNMKMMTGSFEMKFVLCYKCEINVCSLKLTDC